MHQREQLILVMAFFILYTRRCFHSIQALVLCCSPTDGRSVPWGFCGGLRRSPAWIHCNQSIFIQSHGVISARGTRSSNCGGFASRIWMKVQPPRQRCKRGPCDERCTPGNQELTLVGTLDPEEPDTAGWKAGFGPVGSPVHIG